MYHTLFRQKKLKFFRLTGCSIILLIQILASVVPAIWFIELDLLNERSMRHVCRDSLYWMKLTVLPSAIGCYMRKSVKGLIPPLSRFFGSNERRSTSHQVQQTISGIYAYDAGVISSRRWLRSKCSRTEIIVLFRYDLQRNDMQERLQSLIL